MTVPQTEDKRAIVANKGAQFSSYDVNAFEVPSGRDEIWRFTPLRRLRGLHDGSAVATGSTTVTVSGAPESVRVETVGRDDARLGTAGVPTDRIAAQAYTSFADATVVTVASEAELDEPLTITVEGPGVDAVAFGHVQIRVEAFAKATVVLEQRGSGTYAERTSSSWSPTARSSLWSRCRNGTTTPFTSPPTT